MMATENPVKAAGSDVRSVLSHDCGADLDAVADLACDEASVLQQLLASLRAKDDTLRLNSFKVLLQLSQDEPQVLRPEWSYFVKLLDSANAFHRAIGVQILANLACDDPDDRFAEIFEQYFALLDDEKVMVARYLAQNAGQIGLARAELRAAIIGRLLDIEATGHTRGRKDLIRADIIQSFDQLYVESEQKAEMKRFARESLECSSPKARKAAQAFLVKYTP